MKNLVKILLLKLVVMSYAMTAYGTDLTDPRFLSEARIGFAQVFNLDYDDAMGTFAQLRAHYPDHPAPPLHMGVTVWLRELLRRQDLDLNKFTTPTYFDQQQKIEMPLKRDSNSRCMWPKALRFRITHCKRIPAPMKRSISWPARTGLKRLLP